MATNFVQKSVKGKSIITNVDIEGECNTQNITNQSGSNYNIGSSSNTFRTLYVDNINLSGGNLQAQAPMNLSRGNIFLNYNNSQFTTSNGVFQLQSSNTTSTAELTTNLPIYITEGNISLAKAAPFINNTAGELALNFQTTIDLNGFTLKKVYVNNSGKLDYNIDALIKPGAGLSKITYADYISDFLLDAIPGTENIPDMIFLKVALDSENLDFKSGNISIKSLGQSRIPFYNAFKLTSDSTFLYDDSSNQLSVDRIILNDTVSSSSENNRVTTKAYVDNLNTYASNSALFYNQAEGDSTREWDIRLNDKHLAVDEDDKLITLIKGFEGGAIQVNPDNEIELNVNTSHFGTTSAGNLYSKLTTTTSGCLGLTPDYELELNYTNDFTITNGSLKSTLTNVSGGCVLVDASNRLFLDYNTSHFNISSGKLVSTLRVGTTGTLTLTNNVLDLDYNTSHFNISSGKLNSSLSTASTSAVLLNSSNQITFGYNDKHFSIVANKLKSDLTGTGAIIVSDSGAKLDVSVNVNETYLAITSNQITFATGIVTKINKIDPLDTEVDTVKSRITTAEGKITTLQGKDTTQDSTLTTHTAQISALEAKDVVLQTQIGSATALAGSALAVSSAAVGVSTIGAGGNIIGQAGSSLLAGLTGGIVGGIIGGLGAIGISLLMDKDEDGNLTFYTDENGIQTTKGNFVYLTAGNFYYNSNTIGSIKIDGNFQQSSSNPFEIDAPHIVGGRFNIQTNGNVNIPININATNGNISNLITTNVTTSNLLANSISTGTLVFSTLNVNSNTFANVVNTNLISSFSTISNLLLTNLTVSNVIIPSSGNLNVQSTVSLGNLISNNSTIANLSSTAISAGNILCTNSTISNSVLNNLTVSNFVIPSSGNLNVQTTVSLGNLIVNNSTIANLRSMSSTISNMLSTSFTTASLLATTQISTASLLASNSTIPNIVHTNLTTASLLATSQISTGSLLASNSTITNIANTNLTTGSLLATSQISTGSVLASNSTIGFMVSTGLTTTSLLATSQISTGSLLASTSTIPNIVHTNLTTVSLLATSQISTGSLLASNGVFTSLSVGNLVTNTVTNISSTTAVLTAATIANLIATNTTISNLVTTQIVGVNSIASVGLDLALNDNYANLRVIRNATSTFDKHLYLNYDAGATSSTYLYSNNVNVLTIANGSLATITGSLTVSSNITCANLFATTGISTGQLQVTNTTTVNLLTTNFSSTNTTIGNLRISSTANASGGTTSGALIVTGGIGCSGLSYFSQVNVNNGGSSNNLGMGFRWNNSNAQGESIISWGTGQGSSPRLSFQSTPNGSTYTEQVYINTTGMYTKDIYASRGDSTGAIFFGNTNQYLYYDGNAFILTKPLSVTSSTSTGSIRCTGFSQDSTAAFNIDSAGVSGGRFSIDTSGYIGCRTIGCRSIGGANMNFFSDSNTLTGGITNNGATTSYITSSDYRLKKNIKPLRGAIETIKKIKPCNYDYIVNDFNCDGFLAHELQEIGLGFTVNGEKDKKNEKGEDIYQGVDYSKFTPLLVAAIQEQQKQIEHLTKLINKK